MQVTMDAIMCAKHKWLQQITIARALFKNNKNALMELHYVLVLHVPKWFNFRLPTRHWTFNANLI